VNVQIGERVEVEDEITGICEVGTVIFLEPDDEFPEVTYVYLKHEDDHMNDKFDQRFGNFWKMTTI
jgi:hypothetical protein